VVDVLRRLGGRELAPLTAYALGLTSVAAIRPAASYKAIELGASAFEVGLVGGAVGLLAVVVAVPIGMRIDRLGERRFVLAGLALIAAAPLIETVATSLWMLIVGQILLGAGQLSLAIALQTRTANLPSPPSGDERFARLSVATSLAQLLGPLLAGFTIGGTGERSEGLAIAFGASALIGLLGVGIAALTPWTAARGRIVVDTRPTWTKARELVRQEGIAASLTSGIAVSTTADLLVAYLPVLGEEHHLSPVFVGTLLSLRAIATLASRLALSPMIRAIGRRRVLFAALALSAASMLGVVGAGEPWLYGALMLTLGFGLGVSGPITQSWTADSASEDGRGSALALRISANRLGQVIVPTLLGGVAVAFGSGIVFLVAAAGLGLGSVLVRRAPLR
jgi:MFS family permease